jgi:hypothetical protein
MLRILTPSRALALAGDLLAAVSIILGGAGLIGLALILDQIGSVGP